MTLNSKQKKFIKKHIRLASAEAVAKELGVEKELILAYLKKQWRKDKFRAFMERQAQNKLEKFWSNNKIIWGVLVLLVFGVYANSLGNEFVSDDIAGILKNPAVGKLSYVFNSNILIGFLRLLYQYIVFHLFGLAPWAFRLGNVLFHLGSVIFIYLIIKELKTSRLAFVAACLFAVHPILAESVSWISAGGYVQYGFFLLASFWFYIKSNKNLKYYWLSLTSFLMATATNGNSLVFPLILVNYEFCFAEVKRNWKKLLPFFMASGAVAFALASKISTRQTSLVTAYYQDGSRFYNPLTQIPMAITTYIQLISVPWGLTLYHSEMSVDFWGFLIIRLGGMVVFLGAVWMAYKKNRFLFFWLSFFILSLLTVLTPLRVASVVAERYVYLGSLGIIAVIAYFVEKIMADYRWEKMGYGLLLLLLVLLSGRTIIRNLDWKNEDSLWLAAAKTSPNSHNNHNNLGDYYARQGDYKKAEQEFIKAIEILPNYADAYHNLGGVYLRMKKTDKAIESYRKALQFNPNLWQSHRNLAAIYYSQGKKKTAISHLQKALKINPSQKQLQQALAKMTQLQ